MLTRAELFDLAVRAHRNGNISEAETACRRLLQSDPAHAPALHLLGLLGYQSGRIEEAVQNMRRSIELHGTDSSWHFNLGRAYIMQGDVLQAVASFREGLRLEPSHLDGHMMLGSCLKRQGFLEEAAACFRRAFALEYGSSRAHYLLGNVLQEQGLFSEAEMSYRLALARDPRHADAYNNLGTVLKIRGRREEAVLCYRQALAINPRHADAHNNLGAALLEDEQILGAIACFREALACNSERADVHVNLGDALSEQGQPLQAAESFRQALALDPRHPHAHHNLGMVLMDLGLFDEAREHYEQASRLLPGNATVLWNRGLLILMDGDFTRGWREYRHRWNLRNVRSRNLAQPHWDGSALDGKTILVHAEQGLGDTIQFARYLSLVKKQGGSVLFECQPPLLPVCEDLAGVDQLIASGASLPSFDVHVPLLSLPGIFKTTLDTIPDRVPYLGTDPERVEFWKKELEPFGGFRIGVVWQGNPNNPSDRYRSVPLASLGPLANIHGSHLFSLQVGPGTEQVASAGFPITDLGGRFDRATFADLAAVLVNLDLVITVETAVAHLAGALGVPVWVMLSVGGDWRWLRDRTDSPWYPTMRLFRQKRFGDWSEVFTSITSALAALIP